MSELTLAKRGKTWTAKGWHGRDATWTMAKCHECKRPVEVMVGVAGYPCCDDCFGRWMKRTFPEFER